MKRTWKTKAITKNSEPGKTNKNRNDLPRTKTIKWKTLPSLWASWDCQKMTACKTNLLKNPHKTHVLILEKLPSLKTLAGNEPCQKTDRRTKPNLRNWQTQPLKNWARLTAGKPRQPKNEPRATKTKSKLYLQKNTCRQTEKNLKKEKPENEIAGKKPLPARFYLLTFTSPDA